MSDPLILEDVALRWEGYSWVAYNIGRPTPWCGKDWSTQIGSADIDDLFVLFRRSNLTFLPPGPAEDGLARRPLPTSTSRRRATARKRVSRETGERRV